MAVCWRTAILEIFIVPSYSVWVISEAVFTANHSTDTDKQNSTGKYTDQIQRKKTKPRL